MNKSYGDLTNCAAAHYCGPIDTLYIGSAIDQSVGFMECFEELGEAVLKADEKIVIFNPLTAYINAKNAKTPEQLLFVKYLNETAISKSQAAAFAWRNQPSFGVPVEIDYFARAKKPFFVCNMSGKNLGLYLRSAVEESLGFVSTDLDTMSIQVKAYNTLANNGALADKAIHQVKAEVEKIVKLEMEKSKGEASE